MTTTSTPGDADDSTGESTDLLRPHAEQRYAAELAALAALDERHRTASSVKVGELKLKEYAEQEGDSRNMREFNRFLSVIFPDEELLILPYNRVIKDLNNLTEEEFLQRLKD